jgi:4-amino-4-deoxy-L-arabinose transferase-like glycosyltransferase
MPPEHDYTSHPHLDRLPWVFVGFIGGLSLGVGIGTRTWSIDPVYAVLLKLIGGGYLTTSLLALLSARFFSQVYRLQTRVGIWFNTTPQSVSIFFSGLGLCTVGSFTAGTGPSATQNLSLPLWILGIILVCLSLRTQEKSPLPPSEPSGHGRLILLLLLIGSSIRLFGLGNMPYVLSGDEGSVGLVGWEFVDGSRDNLLGLGWFSFPALYSWLLSLSQAIFGRTSLAIRLVSSIAGTISIAATYFAGKFIFNRKVGLIAAAWLTTFHYHVFFSRIAYNNIFDGLFLILCIGFLFRGWKNNSRSDFLSLGLLLGFSQYFYTTSHAIPIILLLWLPWLHLRHSKVNNRSQHLLATLIVTGSVTMPLITTYLSNPDSLTFTAGRVSLLDPSLIGPAAEALGTTPFGLIMEQTLVTVLGLSVGELQGIYLDSGQPMLIGLSLIIYFLGLLIILVRWRQSRSAILLIALLVSILIGGLSIQAPNSQRLILLPPVIALTIAVFLDASQERLNKQWPRLHLLSNVLLLASIGWMAFENLQQLFWEYYPNEHYGSLNGEVSQEMVEFLQEETPGVDIYFIGGNRMQFDSIPSITYLAPALQGESIERLEDLSLPSSIHRRTLFIILPEQRPTLEILASTYPESSIIARYNRHGRLLFYVRILEPAT